MTTSLPSFLAPQHYLDSVCVTEAEDSSYDSDCETDDTNHEQVSRTASDTLGQEFAEYVSCGGGAAATPTSAPKCPAKGGSVPQFPCHMIAIPNSGPGYTSRLEFALKLGYTERLVQAALHRLGPNPTQNELLAELIKLGAQQLPCPAGSSKLNCDYVCDGLLSDCPALSVLGCAPEAAAAAAGSEDAAGQSATGGDVLRPIVIDGSNVAMSHGNKQSFSCRGIKLCVDWFRNRGHKDIVVFVPKWRKESCSLDNPIKDQEILTELERDMMLVFTPSRFVGGKRMVCYDDRYILKVSRSPFAASRRALCLTRSPVPISLAFQLAAENDGIVVSNDNYRDLAQESGEFKKVVEDRILMYSFVSDRFMPPDDPLGRSGPTLDNFLRVQPKKGDLPPPCPYGKKCTYGTKCKFNHPERGSGPHKSVSERLSEHAQRHLSARNEQHARTPLQGKSLSVPLNAAGDQCLGKGQSGSESMRKALCRTRSNVVTADSGSHYAPQFPSPSYGRCQQQQQQQQLQQNLSTTGPCNRLPAWPPVGDPQQGFPKSHSVENLPCENVPTFSMPSSPSQHQLGSQPAASYGQQRAAWPPGAPGRSSSNVSPSGLQHGSEDADGVNLHRKLQRQLTLNPGGCDPRIYQIQRGMCGSQSQQNAPHSPHRPLEPSRSNHCGGTLWEMQQPQQSHSQHGQHQVSYCLELILAIGGAKLDSVASFRM